MFGMRTVLGLTTVLATLGCGGPEEQDGGSPESPRDSPTVYTVNYPLAYFAERIGGDHVAVGFPAPADVDPAFWQPDDTTISAYQTAACASPAAIPV